jgi:hypothetical protein
VIPETIDQVKYPRDLIEIVNLIFDHDTLGYSKSRSQKYTKANKETISGATLSRLGRFPQSPLLRPTRDNCTNVIELKIQRKETWNS